MRQARRAIAAVVIPFALLLASPAVAQDNVVTQENAVAEESGARRWSALDVTLESACVLTLGLDWLQTRSPYDEELNPLLGRHPSRTAVDVYFAGAVLGHIAIAAILPRPWRTVWQATVMGMEIGVVNRNYFAGIKFGF